MNTYRIVWARIPWGHNPQRVDFVDAATPQDAKAVLKAHIERTQRIPSKDVYIFTVDLDQPAPAGKVH